MRVGILGLGTIAHTLADVMNKLDGIRIEAVASRSLEKAEEFKKLYKANTAYGNYEDLYKDPNIDLIYIATPISCHKEEMIKAIEHGKAVLCEKAFCINEKEAEEVLTLAREKNVLVAEAIWTRYMPSRYLINDIIRRGQIGRVTSISANLGYRIAQNERIMSPALGGGALLDLGVYPLNFAFMIAEGDHLIKMSGCASLSDTGVDFHSAMNLVFSSGINASLFVDAESNSNNLGFINGTEGYIKVQNINNPEVIEVYSGSKPPVLLEKTIISHEVSGYEYQLKSVKKALEQGRIEVTEMPHSEILRVMRIMDSFRQAWGVKLSNEQ